MASVAGEGTDSTQIPCSESPHILPSDGFTSGSTQLEKEAVLERVRVTPEQAAEIEEKTREQSGCSEWYKQRRWRVTASFFGRVCKRRSNTSPECLVKSIINQYAFQSMPLPLAWGKKNEDTAVDAYQQHMQGSGHTDLKVARSGLVINPGCPWLGASTDGLVSDPHSADPDGLLEVKCPYKFRESTPAEAASYKEFFCQLENGTVTLKQKHDYYFQIQGQMAIYRRKWCDFVVYTPADISVQRIKFDSNLWETMCAKLTDFYNTAVVPELVHRL